MTLTHTNQLEEIAYQLDQISLRLKSMGQIRISGEVMKCADGLSSEAAWLSDEAINEIKEQSRGMRI